MGSPSRLQLSTANVPNSPSQKDVTKTSLNGLLARAAKAVAEDAMQAENSNDSAQQASSTDANRGDRPTIALGYPANGVPIRSAAVSLSTLTPQSSAIVANLNKNSPCINQLFQNFTGSVSVRYSPAGSPTAQQGDSSSRFASSSKFDSNSQQQGQRPSTPSVQPVGTNRPATAMAHVSINTRSALGSKPVTGDANEQASRDSEANNTNLLKSSYPLPPSTAPAKAVGLSIKSVERSKFGLLSAAFVAAPKKKTSSDTGADDDAATREEASLLANMLASINLAGKAGIR